MINLVYVLLLSTLGSTLPSSPLNIILPITMWWEKIFYQLEDLFQDDIILDIIYTNNLIKLLQDVFLFKLGIIDVCNYKSRHKT